MSIRETLRRQAVADPPALFEGSTGRTMTWSDVLRLAGSWEASGLEGPVGLAIEDPLRMAATFVAALSAAVTVAPLDPSAPPAETEGRIRELGLRALVTDSDSCTRGGRWGIPVWFVTQDGLRLDAGDSEGRPECRFVRPAPKPAVIMASSGTTGKPKIVPLTEEQLTTTAQAVARHLGLGPGERGYSPLPLFHINCLVVGVLSSLVSGSSLVLDRRFSRRGFWSVVEEQGATWLNLVPAIIAILAEERLEPATGAAASPRIRLARSASAPLPETVRQRFERQHHIPVIETYGMTEAASQITANPISAPRPGSVGLPVGLQLRIVDGATRPAEAGQVGRVQISGAAVTDAYWNRTPEGGWAERPATDAAGWLTTGDLGRVDVDGYLYLTGREGDVINRGGEKIQPREIEEVLLTDHRVRAAVVVGRPHATMGEEPVAFVLASDDVTGIEPAQFAAELALRCGRLLSRYKRPAEIRVASSLPAGPTGKIRRAAVREMALATSPASPGSWFQ